MHSHRNQIHYFETLKGLLSMARNPKATDSVYDIEDGLRDLDANRAAVEFIREVPQMDEMIRTRYLRGEEELNLDAMLKLPPESLGYVFARNLTDHGFDPDFFRKREVDDDVDYMTMRLRETHDIWHVVTGFDVNPIGEIGLKGVEIAQTRRPMAAVLTAASVVRFLINEPDRLGFLLAAISAGYQMGLKAQPLLAQKWEEHWDRPLAEWRTMLNLTPVGELAQKEW